MRTLYIGSGVLLAGLAGSLAYQGASGKPAPAENNTTQSKRPSNQKAADGPYGVLCVPADDSKSQVETSVTQHARVVNSPSSQIVFDAKLQSVSKGPAAEETCKQLQPEYQSLEVVIALVPDPNLTRLRLQFDRTIEAITWAARDGGEFNFRNLSIPWGVSEPSELTSLEDRQAAEDERKRALKRPGVLVFTRQGRALAVLLVGESPTLGFNKTQFDTALQYWTTLTARHVPKREKPLNQIPILGPCFSGTFRPLSLALTNVSNKSFHVVSGTATSPVLEMEFSSYLRNRSDESKFEAVNHNDSVRENALRAFLQEDSRAGLWLPTHRRRYLKLAKLSEDESAFGFSAEKYKPPPQTVEDEPRRRPPSPGKEPPADEIPEPHTFVFPRGIAYLRNAYQEDPGLVSLSSQDFGATRRTLQLNLKNREVAKDSVQEFADQTAVSEESQMQVIADSLRHERIDLVAVVATDILDSLFVSRFLRIADPNSRLLFYDSDLLESRSSDYPPLEGSLVVTPYPLFAGRLQWTQVTKAFAFSSQFEEGVYNAATALVQETQGADTHLQDYRPPNHWGEQPPLWLTVIGRDANWPLAILNDPTRPNAEQFYDQWLIVAKGPNLELRPEFPLRSWRVLYRLGWIGGLSLVVIIAWAQWRSSRWCADFGLRSNEAGEYSRAFYLLSLVLSLTAAWLTVMSGPIGYALIPSHDLPNEFWVALGVGAVLAGCAAWLSWRTFWGNASDWGNSSEARKRSDSRKKASIDSAAIAIPLPVIKRIHYRILMFFPWALFASYLVCLWRVLGPSAYFRSFFYAYRSMEIASGVSPTIPLLFLFLAFSTWSYVHLQRRVFAEERFQLLPRFAEKRSSDDLGPIVQDVERSLEATFPGPFRLAAGTALALGVFILYVGYEQMMSLEGRTYDLFFSFVLATLVTLLCLTVWRYYRSWMLFRSFLEHLEFRSIRQAFSALPAEYSWSPVWQHSPRKRTYVLYSRSINCLHELLSALDQLHQPNPVQERLEVLTRLLLDRVSRRLRPSATMCLDLQVALQETAQQIVDVLNVDAWAHGNSDTLEKAGRKDELPKYLILAQEFVALRFVAFIRYVDLLSVI